MNDERLRELYEQALATRGVARSTCPAPEALLALARREGDEAERLRTLDHVMSCPDCRGELDLLRAIHAAAPAGERGTVAPSRGRWRGFVVPLALAATLMVAVSLTLRPRGPAADDGPMRGTANALSVHGSMSRALRAGEPLVLAWHPVSSDARYLVEVLDDAGRAVITRATSDTLVSIAEAGALAAGREYRWWIRSDGSAESQLRSPIGRLRIASP